MTPKLRTLEIVKRAAEAVRSHYGSVGFGTHDVVYDAFNLFLKEIERLENTEADDP